MNVSITSQFKHQSIASYHPLSSLFDKRRKKPSSCVPRVSTSKAVYAFFTRNTIQARSVNFLFVFINMCSRSRSCSWYFIYNASKMWNVCIHNVYMYVDEHAQNENTAFLLYMRRASKIGFNYNSSHTHAYTHQHRYNSDANTFRSFCSPTQFIACVVLCCDMDLFRFSFNGKCSLSLPRIFSVFLRAPTFPYCYYRYMCVRVSVYVYLYTHTWGSLGCCSVFIRARANDENEKTVLHSSYLNLSVVNAWTEIFSLFF